MIFTIKKISHIQRFYIFYHLFQNLSFTSFFKSYMLEPFSKLRKKCHITFIVNKFYNYNTNFNIYIIFNKTIILILIHISKTRYKRTSSLTSHTPFPITPHPCIYRELIKSFVLHVYNSHEELYKCRIVIKCQNCRKKQVRHKITSLIDL